MPKARGFTLIELLVVVAIIALLIGILLPALGEARRTARLVIDLSKSKQLGTGANSYAADYQDKLFSFTWKKGDNKSKYADLNAQAQQGDLAAAAAQAVDILRRRADREDIPPIGGWIPHVLYSHLVLQDYIGQTLPDRLVISTADKQRLLWASDPRAFDQGAFNPSPAGGPTNARWPYSASFEVTSASYDNSTGAAPATVSRRIYQGGVHYTYAVPGNCDLGRVKLADTAYPAQKVHMMDRSQRHFGKLQLYFGYPVARTVVVFMDASASARKSVDANRGWHPQQPTLNTSMVHSYEPRAWEAPTLSGQPSDVIAWGYHRWCRGFNRGVDFNGREVYTGQPLQ
jgi:prepilin-type N-terminal cleavage/methylation domain-containing protein